MDIKYVSVPSSLEDKKCIILTQYYYVTDRFYCPNGFCNRSYKNKRSLRRHIKDECGVDPKFKCKYCDKFMFRKTTLQKHQVNCSAKYCVLKTFIAYK